MKDGRALTAAMIVFALVVVPMAAYVGGYYGLAETTVEYSRRHGVRVVDRVYSYSWQAAIFTPAGRVDEWLMGGDVQVYCLDDKPVDIIELR